MNDECDRDDGGTRAFPVPGRGALVGWRRLIFPAVFLIYLVQTAVGVTAHSHGVGIIVGWAILVAFCACYLLAMSAGWDHRESQFRLYYAAMLALTVAELPFAHQDAFVMLVYVSVLTVAALFHRALPIVIALALVSALLPHYIPSWHAQVDWSTSVAIVLVALAMYGFFGVVRSNQQLAQARSEVARLATENERTRIARDLHDLLGHSLTTITVKAALANRIAERDPQRAATEIAEVEGLARRALTDVRAAVAGYREVTLGNELAAAHEVLRAAGISAQLPRAIDSIGADESALFAWVVREGVTNVVRHSRASNCEVRLGQHSIEIIDDGVGNSVTRSANGGPPRGSGLIGLRERVAGAGGTIVVGSQAPSPGWRLRVEVPA